LLCDIVKGYRDHHAKRARRRQAVTWERDAELVVRVERFISAAFHWHRAGSARDTLEALARSVQQGAVYVVQEDMPVSGGYVASGKRNTSWLGAVEEASSAMSFKEHYLAQLERMNADRPTWAGDTRDDG
jgi:hypothetical protein